MALADDVNINEATFAVLVTFGGVFWSAYFAAALALGTLSRKLLNLAKTRVPMESAEVVLDASQPKYVRVAAKYLALFAGVDGVERDADASVGPGNALSNDLHRRRRRQLRGHQLSLSPVLFCGAVLRALLSQARRVLSLGDAAQHAAVAREAQEENAVGKRWEWHIR